MYIFRCIFFFLSKLFSRLIKLYHLLTFVLLDIKLHHYVSSIRLDFSVNLINIYESCLGIILKNVTCESGSKRLILRTEHSGIRSSATIRIKIMDFRAVVLFILLHACEIWTLYQISGAVPANESSKNPSQQFGGPNH